MNNGVIATALVCLIIITFIVLVEFIQLQMAISKIEEAVNRAIPTSGSTSGLPPMSNKAYWDCSGNPTTTYSQCQVYR